MTPLKFVYFQFLKSLIIKVWKTRCQTKKIKFHIQVKVCFILYTYYVGTRTIIILKTRMLKWKNFCFKSDFRFSSYFVLDSTYIIYTWTIMIYFLNAKMGKINSKVKKSDFIFGLYFVFNCTYIVQAQKIMILKTRISKGGKKNQISNLTNFLCPLPPFPSNLCALDYS